HSSAKVRVVLQIQRNLPWIIALETGETVLYIGRISDLRRLSVAHHIDSDFHLSPDRLRNSFSHHPFEFDAVVRFAVLSLEKQIHDVVASRQAADMCRKDAVRTALHRRVSIQQPSW